MREHLHSAVTRRNDRLARVRKLTLWITGGAAAASLGLGTAFAHSLPGHSAGAATPAAATHAAPPAGGSGHGAGRQHRTGAGRHHHDNLAAPAHAPAPAPSTPAPAAPVTSGGS